MSLPVHDWQFWVVTLAALLAALWLARGVLMGKRRRRRARERRAVLTVGGKAVR